MKLSVRLQAILEVINPCNTIADIGCDHAQLAIALIEQKRCNHVFASDLRLGPIQKAQEAVIRSKMENSITCIHGDGLEKIPFHLDGIVIAGMGFETIRHILSVGREKAKKAHQIVLASHTQVPTLRKWLFQQGYTIDKERIVFDKFYYEILSIHYEPININIKIDYEFGLYAINDPLFKEMLKHKLTIFDEILKQVPKDSTKYLDVLTMKNKYCEKIKEATVR